ncbi:TolC family protein [Geminocystis sp. CENA526]|uniref:TolC family protein n=1 Tax=Geminocystis sp. CENA526 TaxID=1355871 RepID=UPI003D6F7B5B
MNIIFSINVKSEEINDKSEQKLNLLLNNNNQELPLNLADAVYLALENNRELKIAYLQRILEEKQLAEIESQFNPKFTPQLEVNWNNNDSGNNQRDDKILGLNVNVNWKIPTGGEFTILWKGQNQLSANTTLNDILNNNVLSQGINFNFSQPLLKNFGVRFNSINIEKARLTETANILKLKNTNSQIITNTILAYRNLVLAQEQLKIEQLSIENGKKDLERLQALFEFGRIPQNDLIERQADIAQQEVTLVTTQNALEEAITNLTKILDLPLDKKLIAQEIPQPPTNLNLPNYEEMLELALSNNFNYLTAFNDVKNAKLNIIEAENQQKWDLRFNFSVNHNIASNADDQRAVNSSLILSREWGNLSQDNALEKSKSSLEIANLTFENATKNLEEELKTRMRNVQDTFRRIQLAQQARQLAETRLTNAKERMRLNGNVSMTDIINFEKGLVDAKNQELNAVISHLNTITQLENFLGLTKIF